MRSKLFVPGSRPELFGKAIASDADAISFDVEDSVSEQSKARARDNIAEFLCSMPTRESLKRSNKTIIVRINGVGSRHFEQDLMAFACLAVTMLNLPKVERAEDVRHAAAILEKYERHNGLTSPIAWLVNIETPRAIRLASEIADAHPRVVGLQLGLTDLFESLSIERNDVDNVHAGMFAVRLASGESGRFAYDSAFPNVADEQGFRREAELARRLGYIGKSCVHPKQVTIANEVFRVELLQLETARRILEAAEEAATRGRGAFMLDGRMIDLPTIKRAEALLSESKLINRESS